MGHKMFGDELKLADVVVMDRIGVWDTATVKQIVGKEITFFRPYVITSEFAYTGGVICYIGIEEVKITPRDGDLFEVLERRDLKQVVG